jgi:dipeptidyl aminopeptidase/acylaminoacyl peptidase
MVRRLVFLLILLFILGGIVFINSRSKTAPKDTTSASSSDSDGFGGLINQENPLSIEYMRKQSYPGSDIIVEQTLDSGSNYQRYLVSYKSDGLKIYSLLTVPDGDMPKSGWPVVIFNHGYIPPTEYRTTERYIAYTDAFSRNGYIVFKSDYRGHGNSEGRPEGGYYSPAYTIDVMNGLASVKRLKASDLPGGSGQQKLADVQRIGMWGHSMGGSITLRSMVIDKEIKAGVIWAGVVANYEDLAKNWHRSAPTDPADREQQARRNSPRQNMVNKYGTFEANKAFWDSIAPISYVKDLTAPIQIHHGTEDEEVPILFSQRLDDAMKKNNKSVEFYTYEGADHNISQYVDQALQRSIDFFDKYLKGE